MLFNPGSEIFYDTTLLSPLDIFLGGHHFIYITRQAYDGCTQLHQALSVPEITSSAWDAISSITWTSIPILKKGDSWLPIDKGLIPNDLTIGLRVVKPFQYSQENTDLNDMRKCRSGLEYPLYQFELANKIVSSSHDLETQFALPWSFKNNFQGFTISNVSKKCTVEVYNLAGQCIDRGNLDPGEEFIWTNFTSQIKSGIIFTKVHDLDSGKWQSYKTIVIKE